MQNERLIFNKHKLPFQFGKRRRENLKREREKKNKIKKYQKEKKKGFLFILLKETSVSFLPN